MAGEIDQIVNVSIQAANATPQLPGFGTPALIAYHTHNSDYIRTYTSLAGLVADGFGVHEPAYLWAQSVLAQTPAVSQFKIIRGTTSVAQVIKVKVVSPTNLGQIVGCVLTDASGVDHNLLHTVGAGPESAHTVAVALAALSISGVSLAVDGGDNTMVNVTVSASGAVWYPKAFVGVIMLDATPDASVATDLNNALTIDTDFYGVTDEHQDGTNITALGVWAEANKRIQYFTTYDTSALDSGDGIFYSLKAAGYTYTTGLYSGTSITYSASALESNEFTRTPGTYTNAYKQLAGVTFDKLTATNLTNLGTNNGNYYTSVANVASVKPGINASGLYTDLRRGIDALAQQIQLQIYQLLLNQPKVPYDPHGIAMIGGEVASAMAQFTASPSQRAALLRNDPGFQPQVILPAIASTSSLDRGNRILRNVQFVCYAQNAVQTVKVVGTINV